MRKPEASRRPTADGAVVNARIWTGTENERRSPGARAEPTALAFRGDRILVVGDDALVRGYFGRHTNVLDASGRRVIPGITDSHTHLINGGLQLQRLHLRDVHSREEFIRAVAQAAATKTEGQWVLGGRWSVESWADRQPPTKAWLDHVTADVPVFLNRMDGHSALVNSAALKLAGITASGPADPTGGEIERDPATGEPTGILKEAAMGLVRRLIPQPTEEERYAALRRAMEHANSLGITGVHDMCSRADVDAFRRAEQAGVLTLRITGYLNVADWAQHMEFARGLGEGSDMFWLAGFKGFMDGSMGSRTAYMREPYRDATADTLHPRGQLTAMANPVDGFERQVALADARGLQLAVHAIGDEANHLLLNAYEAARSSGGQPDARHRVEHAQHLVVSDLPRFAKLGVVASMQPFHKADDGRYAEQAIGPTQLAGSYAFRQLVDAGALVIFGSDWPVVTLNPFAGVDAAVNAKTLDGKVWLPDHSLSVEESLRAYTVRPPRAIHREDRLGTLAPGYYADFVILSDDPFAMPKERVGEVTVVQTFVGGRSVWQRSGPGGS